MLALHVPRSDIFVLIYSFCLAPGFSTQGISEVQCLSNKALFKVKLSSEPKNQVVGEEAFKDHQDESKRQTQMERMCQKKMEGVFSLKKGKPGKTKGKPGYPYNHSSPDSKDRPFNHS